MDRKSFFIGSVRPIFEVSVRLFNVSNISTEILIMEQKIINNCASDTLISLKSYVWLLK